MVRPRPGVVELLEALPRRGNVVLALLTGNIQQTAPLSWRRRASIPASSSPGPMVRTAWNATSYSPSRCSGPRRRPATISAGAGGHRQWATHLADIRCARSGGGLAIAVATGPYSGEMLRAHQPDHPLPRPGADGRRIARPVPNHRCHRYNREDEGGVTLWLRAINRSWWTALNLNERTHRRADGPPVQLGHLAIPPPARRRLQRRVPPPAGGGAWPGSGPHRCRRGGG